MSDSNASGYWDHFYSDSAPPTVPSQFAAFVASEFPGVRNILELGAGNGRDVALWASRECNVVAVDQSQRALDLSRAALPAAANVTYLAGDLGESATWEAIQGLVAAMPPGPIIVFARFFLHAIPLETEQVVLAHVVALLAERGGSLCLEFRTDRDAALSKVTGDHYRRFIRPSDFMTRLNEAGLDVDYFVEGVGFAKFRQDDAYVARVLASLRTRG